MKEKYQEFLELVEGNQGILHKVCRLYASAEESPDLIQDMLVSLWKAYPSFRGESKPTTWMYRIALYTALSYRKYASYRKFDALEENFDMAQTEDMAAAEAHEIITHALRKLPDDDRALMLLYLEEHSYEEISGILGISVSNVGVRLSRTKKRLKTIIEKQSNG